MNIALYINIAANQLLASLGQSSTVSASSIPLFAGDTPQFSIYLLTPTTTFTPSSTNFLQVNPTGISPYFYIDDGAFESDVIYASLLGNSQDANPNDGWVIDPSNTFFQGNVSLNTAAIQTVFETASSLSAYLHVGIIQAGIQSTILLQSVTIKPGIPNPAPATVPPGLTALSVQAANGIYWPQVGLPGRGPILTSPFGKKVQLILIDNPDGTASVQWNPLN